MWQIAIKATEKLGFKYLTERDLLKMLLVIDVAGIILSWKMFLSWAVRNILIKLTRSWFIYSTSRKFNVSSWQQNTISICQIKFERWWDGFWFRTADRSIYEKKTWKLVAKFSAVFFGKGSIKCCWVERKAFWNHNQRIGFPMRVNLVLLYIKFYFHVPPVISYKSWYT